MPRAVLSALPVVGRRGRKDPPPRTPGVSSSRACLIALRREHPARRRVRRQCSGGRRERAALRQPWRSALCAALSVSRVGCPGGGRRFARRKCPACGIRRSGVRLVLRRGLIRVSGSVGRRRRGRNAGGNVPARAVRAPGPDSRSARLPACAGPLPGCPSARSFFRGEEGLFPLHHFSEKGYHGLVPLRRPAAAED